MIPLHTQKKTLLHVSKAEIYAGDRDAKYITTCVYIPLLLLDQHCSVTTPMASKSEQW